MFCPKSVFFCRLCSGKSAVGVWEPKLVRVDTDQLPVGVANEISSPILENDLDFNLPHKDRDILISPRVHSDEKSSPNAALLNTFFYTQVLESVPHCGDSNYWDAQRLSAKDMPDLKESLDQQETPQDYFTLAPLKMELDAPLLVSITDEIFHGLASLRHVGDYADPPGALDQPSPQEVIDESITIPDFSSSNTHDELFRARSSTRWIQHSRMRGKYKWKLAAEPFEQSRNQRPDAPIRFSRRTNSEPSTERCNSLDSLALEPNLGHTSTTHEVRWTQVEQDTINTAGTMDANLLLPIDSRLSDRSPLSHRSGRRTNSTSAAQVIRDNPLEGKRYKSLPSLTPGYPFPEPSSCAGDVVSGVDNSMLALTENAFQSTHTLDDSTMARELTYSHSYLNAPLSGRHCSPFSYSTIQLEGRTDAITRQPSFRPGTVLPRSLPSTPVPDLLSHPFAECTECILRERFEQPDEGTTRMDTLSSLAFDSYPKSIQKRESVSLSCILSGAPVGSEPPSIRIRPKHPKLSSSTLRLATEDETFTLPTSSVSKSFILRHHRMPNKTLEHAIPPALRYIPFEGQLLPLSRSPIQLLMRLRKPSDLTDLDLNKSCCMTSTAVESVHELQKNRDNVLQCVYVEVSLCRNLNGVASPDKITDHEANAVHTLLSRRLQNAVATRFMTHPTMVLPRHTNTSDHSAPDEDGDVPNRPMLKRSSSSLGKIKTRGNSYLQFLNTRVAKSSDSRSRRSRANRGIYAFTPGPLQVKLPGTWCDHIRSGTPMQGRSTCAWKISDLETYIGGLINVGHHLHIIASSNDGRLGLVYQQAEILLSEMTHKGTTYVNRSSTAMDSTGPQDIVRLFFRSSMLYRLISRSLEQMSTAVGIDCTNVNISAITQQAFPKYSNVISIEATRLDTMNTMEHMNSLLLCVNALSALHQELNQNAPTLKLHVMPVESAEYLLNRMQQQHSMGYSYFPQQLIKNLRDVTTSYNGTLSHCIRTNAYCPWELYPRACDPNAYDVFNDIFDPILGKLARVNEASSQPKACYALPCDLSVKTPVSKVLNFQVRFCRNLHGFGFPPVMSERDFVAVQTLCKAALLSWNEEGTGTYYSIMDLEHRNFKLFSALQRKQLLIPAQTATRKVFGTYRFWPHGRGIYVAPETVHNCDLVVQVNADDHLRLLCVDWTGKRPFMAYNRAVRLLTWLESKLKFCRSPRWGNLSSVPLNVGTGLKFSCGFKIANVGKDPTPAVERVCAQYKLRIDSKRRPASALSPYIFEVTPISSLGRTEASIGIHFLEALQDMSQAFGRYILP